MIARYEPKAYSIEREVFSGTQLFHCPMKLAIQTGMVESLAVHFEGELLHNDIPITVKRRRGRQHVSTSWARPKDNTITFGSHAGPAIVCHEFAHLMAGRKDGFWHGTQWAVAYVECVNYLIGEEWADKLGTALADRGVMKISYQTYAV